MYFLNHKIQVYYTDTDAQTHTHTRTHPTSRTLPMSNYEGKKETPSQPPTQLAL